MIIFYVIFSYETTSGYVFLISWRERLRLLFVYSLIFCESKILQFTECSHIKLNFCLNINITCIDFNVKKKDASALINMVLFHIRGMSKKKQNS